MTKEDAQTVLEFLDSIADAGYAGMTAFDVAREIVKRDADQFTDTERQQFLDAVFSNGLS